MRNLHQNRDMLNLFVLNQTNNKKKKFSNNCFLILFYNSKINNGIYADREIEPVVLIDWATKHQKYDKPKALLGAYP